MRQNPVGPTTPSTIGQIAGGPKGGGGGGSGLTVLPRGREVRPATALHQYFSAACTASAGLSLVTALSSRPRPRRSHRQRFYVWTRALDAKGGPPPRTSLADEKASPPSLAGTIIPPPPPHVLARPTRHPFEIAPSVPSPDPLSGCGRWQFPQQTQDASDINFCQQTVP